MLSLQVLTLCLWPLTSLGSKCVRWAKEGHLLFYGNTRISPIGISIPLEFVQTKVPWKNGDIAPFVGSRKGGDTKEYTFGPGDERDYFKLYARHRVALTQRKGGWDASRHAEIMACGTVPRFKGLSGAPPFSIPFLPVTDILLAERLHLDGRDRSYNATVTGLLQHTRDCLSNEAMAQHVLQTMGLWPTNRPLQILYLSCGWGWSSRSDGWQGPVSIQLYIGLQRLLQRIPGSRVVDAPFLHIDGNDSWPEWLLPSYMWYTYANVGGAAATEPELRGLMYGYGFSYAFRLPGFLAATQSELEAVPERIKKHDYDAIIFGKVGPAQGCDPLPYIDEILEADFPAERVALIYGGDFGLKHPEVARHVGYMGTVGHIFMREINVLNAQDLLWKPQSVLPSACYLDGHWRDAMKLWTRRMECWGCAELDDALEQAIWPEVKKRFGSSQKRCWSMESLLALVILPRREEECPLFTELLSASSQNLGRHSMDFFEVFGVWPSEIITFVLTLCRGDESSKVALSRDIMRVMSMRVLDSDEGQPLSKLRSLLAYG